MFGLGFSEIIIIVIIAILFLGPDKLPTAMVEVAKFFRNMKSTISTVKSSLEEEIHVSEIKQEAMAYKNELLNTTKQLEIKEDIESALETKSEPKSQNIAYVDENMKKAPKEAEPVTFEKKPSTKVEDDNV